MYNKAIYIKPPRLINNLWIGIIPQSIGAGSVFGQRHLFASLVQQVAHAAVLVRVENQLLL